MKQAISIFILIAYTAFTNAQTRKIDSLDNLIKNAKSDTQKINISVKKISSLEDYSLDSAISFGNRIIDEAKKINYEKGEVDAKLSLSYAYVYKGLYANASQVLDDSKRILSRTKDSLAISKMNNEYGVLYGMQNKYDSGLIFYKRAINIAESLQDYALMSTINQNIGIAYQQQSQFPLALQFYQKALTASEKQNDKESEAYIYLNMGITFSIINDTSRSIQYLLKAVNLANELGLKTVATYAYANLASVYAGLKDFNKEYDYALKSAALAQQTGDQGIQASSLSRAAAALASRKDFTAAEKLCRQAMQIADSSNQPLNIYQTYAEMGDILKEEGKCDIAVSYLEKALHKLTDADLYDFQVVDSYKSLSDCYEQKGDYNKALTAYKTATRINDSLQSKENVRKATELAMNYDFDKKQQAVKIEQQKKDELSKTKQTALFIGLMLMIVVAGVAYYAFSNKKKTNKLLQQQKAEIETTLNNLKNTQTQLIHAEKMASLGELTAGIAHEIQNPLNFVNNFSELNKEMLEELKAERLKLKEERDEGLQNDIINDVINNEEKINHHGKRADAIVKGMLQHSKKSTGQKEPALINDLCFEYMRLSYLNLRAKDKSFDADFKTDFDASIEKINIIPQDIGRVLVNLANNAFYAVNEKSKQLRVNSKQPLTNAYKPVVSVTTKKINDKIEITVSDNGNGIATDIIGKIFQPFFTTKPTGEGTGLGLSLSYDIITKEHNGTIKAESTTGEGTKFIINLPA